MFILLLVITESVSFHWYRHVPPKTTVFNFSNLKIFRQNTHPMNTEGQNMSEYTDGTL